jgi:hypothetical protein
MSKRQPQRQRGAQRAQRINFLVIGCKRVDICDGCGKKAPLLKMPRRLTPKGKPRQRLCRACAPEFTKQWDREFAMIRATVDDLYFFYQASLPESMPRFIDEMKQLGYDLQHEAQNRLRVHRCLSLVQKRALAAQGKYDRLVSVHERAMGKAGKL